MSGFIIEDGILKKYTGKDAVVVIPDGVTSIGHMAFCDCTMLTSVTIPDSVTSIGYEAFYGCTGLTSIAIGRGVTDIRWGAFYGCIDLASITIPDSMGYIGSYAFENTSLKTISKNYKAFYPVDGELVCRNFVYTPQEWSQEIRHIEVCKSGYHYCTNLFSIFNYYYGKIDESIIIYECEVGDKVETEDREKWVTNKIKPVKRLCREDVVRILNGQD